MGSLKEIKVRIASIRSTQKITAAMKMVSSAKFHHAQTQTEHTLTYANKLSAILNGLLFGRNGDLDSPYTEQRKGEQGGYRRIRLEHGVMRDIQCQYMERVIRHDPDL